jgi:hypothetical protein
MTPNPSSRSTASHRSNTGVIAGGVVAGVILLSLVSLFVWFLCCRPRLEDRELNQSHNEAFRDLCNRTDIGELPPEYRRTLSPPIDPLNPSPLQPQPIRSTPSRSSARRSRSSQARRSADIIGQYAATHRGFISVELERKLRAAGYYPGSNPSDLTEDEWGRYGVGPLELGRLQELYDRYIPKSRASLITTLFLTYSMSRSQIVVTTSREVHSSGQASPAPRASS